MHALDTLSMNQPPNLIERFALCVDGELNDSTLGFLSSVNKSNPMGLADLITKLQKLQMQLDADTLHRVVTALTDQLKIPHNALETIQNFLEEDNKQELLTELQTLAINESKLHQSIFHMMDNLHIFCGDSLVEQFLRTMLSIMLEWASNPQRNVKESARWLKSVLNIPYKSIMGQIIQLIADHLHLSECLITGKTRTMDGLELFFLLKNLTVNTEVVLVTETNKQFMSQIHAAIFTIMIYRNSQHAFYDVVSWQENHPNFSILSLLEPYQTVPMVMEQFLQSSAFKPYFPQQRYQDNPTNQHVFLSSLGAYIHAETETDSDDVDLSKITDFAKLCVAQYRNLDSASFMNWFQNNAQLETLEPLVLSSLFHRLFTRAENQKLQHSGRIRSSAMNLVALGFSHRSTATLTTGAFKPLVNVDIADIDAYNIAAMTNFFNQQAHANRLKLLQEIFLGYTAYIQSLKLAYQEKNKKVAEQSKALQLLNIPKLKSTLPQVFRANPINRNRMFTPKPAPKKGSY